MILPKESIQNLARISEKEPSRLFKHRMDRNERTHPFSKSFMKYLKDELNGEVLMTYPEPEPLYEAFSKWLGVGRDKILFHSGSDLAIKAVFETYIRPGDKILLHRPGYAMYQVYAKMFQADVETLDYDADLNFNIARYIEMVDGRYRMVVLENPNGFVGDKRSPDDIRALISKADRSGALVLVDEAYFHFIDETAADLIKDFDNLIVVRTFSKAFGLAGLRAAYLLSADANIQYLYRVKPMHELNSMAIFAILALIKHEGEFKGFIKDTKDSLDYLKSSINALNIPTSDSCANFLAARFGAAFDSVDLARYLSRYGFLIRRPFREKHLGRWLRVGTLPIELEKAMISRVKEYMKSNPIPRKVNT